MTFWNKVLMKRSFFMEDEKVWVLSWYLLKEFIHWFYFDFTMIWTAYLFQTWGIQDLAMRLNWTKDWIMKMNNLQTMSCILSSATTKKQILLMFCFILADYQLDMCSKKKTIRRHWLLCATIRINSAILTIKFKEIKAI